MNHSIILFDGVCNYCNALVRFIIANDTKDCFRFAAQQSDAGKRILQEHHLEITLNDTFYLIENGKAYSHSTAAFKVFRHLRWYWKWMYIFIIIPPFIRDFFYNLIAKNRYKIFGRKDECMIPSKEIKGKFLD